MPADLQKMVMLVLCALMLLTHAHAQSAAPATPVGIIKMPTDVGRCCSKSGLPRGNHLLHNGTLITVVDTEQPVLHCGAHHVPWSNLLSFAPYATDNCDVVFCKAMGTLCTNTARA